jgi:hypothetical protein
MRTGTGKTVIFLLNLLDVRKYEHIKFRSIVVTDPKHIDYRGGTCRNELYINEAVL